MVVKEEVEGHRLLCLNNLATSSGQQTKGLCADRESVLVRVSVLSHFQVQTTLESVHVHLAPKSKTVYANTRHITIPQVFVANAGISYVAQRILANQKTFLCRTYCRV